MKHAVLTRGALPSSHVKSAIFRVKLEVWGLTMLGGLTEKPSFPWGAMNNLKNRGVFYAAFLVFFFHLSHVQAAEIEIGFSENASALGLTPTTPEFDLAQKALDAKYAVENGFVRSQMGAGNSIVVVTTHKRYSKAIWSKMTRSGDAGTSASKSVFFYQGPGEVSAKDFDWVRPIEISEGNTRAVRTPGRSANVRSYLVKVDPVCTVASSDVDPADINEKLAPIELLKRYRVGGYDWYHYSVNGGRGAEIRGVAVGLTPPKGPIFYRTCWVAVGYLYVK